ncbi:hypothetical protein MMC32_008299 [Xylographa parallela]|nr:hypothetical protein [Xylographa parallela]
MTQNTLELHRRCESINNVPPIVQLQGLDQSAEQQNSRDPPDGGYGWVCVATCFSINCFTWGIVASYGVYLEHYLSQNIFPEADPMDFAFVGGLNFSMAMLVAPLVTILARKRGTQFAMAIGVVLSAVGFIFASFAHNIWQLYISQGILLGFGVGFTYIPSIAILSQWFQEKRSLANGISAAGSGIGGLVFSLATEAMINNISIAWSFRITAIVACIANIIATLLIRNRNETIRPPQRGFDTALLRRYDVLLLLSWSFVSMLGYITLLFSLPDFAHTIGLSSGQAASISSILNAGTATIGPISVEIAGLAELPSLLSLSWISLILPTTFSEVVALRLRRPGSDREYLYAQIFAGLAYVVASGCMFELRRIKHKQ